MISGSFDAACLSCGEEVIVAGKYESVGAAAVNGEGVDKAGYRSSSVR